MRSPISVLAVFGVILLPGPRAQFETSLISEPYRPRRCSCFSPIIPFGARLIRRFPNALQTKNGYLKGRSISGTCGWPTRSMNTRMGRSECWWVPGGAFTSALNIMIPQSIRSFVFLQVKVMILQGVRPDFDVTVI